MKIHMPKGLGGMVSSFLRWLMPEEGIGVTENDTVAAALDGMTESSARSNDRTRHLTALLSEYDMVTQYSLEQDKHYHSILTLMTVVLTTVAAASAAILTSGSAQERIQYEVNSTWGPWLAFVFLLLLPLLIAFFVLSALHALSMMAISNAERSILEDKINAIAGANGLIGWHSVVFPSLMGRKPLLRWPWVAPSYLQGLSAMLFIGATFAFLVLLAFAIIPSSHVALAYSYAVIACSIFVLLAVQGSQFWLAGYAALDAHVRDAHKDAEKRSGDDVTPS